MSDACEDPEIERRIERYLEGVLSGEACDLEALARELPEVGALRCLRAGALAEEYLALCADGRAPAQRDFLARLAHPDERARFERIVRDGETARAVLPGELAPGVRLDGRYEILREVGKGGMGTVYLCEHATLKRRVAVKVLAPELAENKVAVERFLREARSASALSHQNIVRVHHVGQAGGTHYIVMEYVDGATL